MGHKHLRCFSELMEILTSESSMLRTSLPGSVFRTAPKNSEALAVSKLATHIAFFTEIKHHNIMQPTVFDNSVLRTKKNILPLVKETVHNTIVSNMSTGWHGMAWHGTALQELHCTCACCVFSSSYREAAQGNMDKYCQKCLGFITSLMFPLFVFFLS